MPVNPDAFQRIRVGAEAFIVRDSDIAGPMLKRLGQLHRKQERRLFATEGAVGATGRWAPLSPGYAVRKRAYLGRKGKILVRDGDMKEALTEAHGGYIQRYVKPFLQFGAESAVAVYHFLGNARLPKRDPISKSEAQLQELRQGIVDWWKNERLPQILRGAARLERRR